MNFEGKKNPTNTNELTVTNIIHVARTNTLLRVVHGDEYITWL